MRFAKILITPILKNICERLLLIFLSSSTLKWSYMLKLQSNICLFHLDVTLDLEVGSLLLFSARKSVINNTLAHICHNLSYKLLLSTTGVFSVH